MIKNHYIIVGGTRGIGKEIVNMLVEDKNNNVSVIGRAPSFSYNYHNLKEYAADVSNNDSIFSIIKDAVNTFGNISTVVFLQRNRSINDDTKKDIEIAILATRTIIDHLISNNLFNLEHLSKSIVMVSSIADKYIAEEQPVGYHIAKAGLVQLARYYALKLGPLGIRVNIVSPCVVLKIEASKFYNNNQSLVKRYNDFIPLGRMGKPEDIANAVIYLSSDKASYITGQNLVIDGGLTLRSHESLLRDII